MLVIKPSNEALPDKVLTTYHSYFSYLDMNSKDELAAYDTYFVKGGWVIRGLGISENSSPLTISPSSCSHRIAGYLTAPTNSL